MFWRSLIKLTISTPSSPVFSLDLTVSCGWWLYQEMWRWTQIRPDYAKMSDYTAPDISTLKVSKNFADHNVAFTFKKYWDTIMIGHLNITDRRFGIAIIPKTVCQWRSLWTSVPISRVENIYKILRAKFCWGLYISPHTGPCLQTRITRVLSALLRFINTDFVLRRFSRLYKDFKRNSILKTPLWNTKEPRNQGYSPS